MACEEDDRRPLVHDAEQGIDSESASANRNIGRMGASDAEIGAAEIELQVVGAMDGAEAEVSDSCESGSPQATRAKRPRWWPSGHFSISPDRSWLKSCASRLRACSDKCGTGSSRDEAMPPFYPIDSTPPWAMSIFMGLQHALAMAAGIVSIPIVISGATAFQLPTPDTQYLISVGLIMSGLSSLMQVHRFKLPNGKFLGTGESGVVLSSSPPGFVLMHLRARFLRVNPRTCHAPLLIVCRWLIAILSITNQE